MNDSLTWISVIQSIELVAQTWEGLFCVHSEKSLLIKIYMLLTSGEQDKERWTEEEMIERSEGSTHGVSSMTRHTQAMVLRQSVVSSMGKVLFWRMGEREIRAEKTLFNWMFGH